MIVLQIQRMQPDAIVPHQAHPGDAGLDLYAHIKSQQCGECEGEGGWDVDQDGGMVFDRCLDCKGEGLVGCNTEVFEPGDIAPVGTGVAVAIPPGHAGLILPRSGLSSGGLVVANAPGLIDSGYRGEVKVLLHNVSPYPHAVNDRDRIGQLLVVPFAEATVLEVSALDKTARGAGGFGSTGR